MAIEEKEINSEESKKTQQNLESKSKAMTDEIFNSLDLPAAGLEQKQEEETEEEEAAESEDETPEEEPEEEETTEEEEEAPEEEGEEELIPKSKVEKAKTSMQKRIDALTKENKHLKAQSNKAEETPSDDPQQKKLDTLSIEQLQQLKKNVRRDQVKSQDNDERLDQLIELEEKIDKTIQEAPRKFETKQLSHFNEAVKETASDPEIKNFKAVAPEIFETAKNIYARSATLQKSVRGQAEAWDLAVEHYKTLSQVSAGKETVKRLNTQVNTLKKKTSLDANNFKGGNKQKADLEKMRQKANRGDSYDKEQFVKNALISDDFIPEQFKR